MRRLCRWLVNGLTALSLLLCVATGVLWVRSYRYEDSVYWYKGTLLLGVASVRGEIVLFDDHFPGYRDGWHRTSPPVFRRAEDLLSWYHLGFGYQDSRAGTLVIRRIGFPHALPALLTGLPPLLRLGRKLRRRRRLTSGLCPACGYDLRATPDRCPECGTIAMEA